MKQKNLLLITTDQWRVECLSMLGHPVVKTPNLDALADDGVLHGFKSIVMSFEKLPFKEINKHQDEIVNIANSIFHEPKEGYKEILFT